MTFPRQMPVEWADENRDYVMRKRELDHLLEAAVAKALGVKLPASRRRAPATPRKSHQVEPIQHAA